MQNATARSETCLSSQQNLMTSLYPGFLDVRARVDLASVRASSMLLTITPNALENSQRHLHRISIFASSLIPMSLEYQGRS